MSEEFSPPSGTDLFPELYQSVKPRAEHIPAEYATMDETNPNNLSFGESVAANAKSRVTGMGEGLQDLWERVKIAFGSGDKQELEKLQGEWAQRRLQDERSHGKAPGAMIGKAAPDIIAGLATRNPLVFGGLEAATTPGSATERATAGATATAGAWGGNRVGELISKGAGMLKGKSGWVPAEAAGRQDRAEKYGMKATLGDLNPNSIIRGAENFAEDHMSRALHRGPNLDAQTEWLGKNLIYNQKLLKGIERTTENLNNTSRSRWENEVYSLPTATGVQPFDTRAKLVPFMSKFGSKLKAEIDDEEVWNGIVQMTSNPKRIPSPLDFREMRELQSNIGSLARKFETLSADTSRKLDPNIARGLKEIQTSIHSDLRNWGKNPGNKDAFDKYSEVNKWYRNEVIPYMKNPIVEQVRAGKFNTSNQSDLLREITPHTRLEARNELEAYGKRYDPGFRRQDGQLETMDEYIKLVNTFDRAARKVAHGTPDPKLSFFETAAAIKVPQVMGGLHASEGFSSHPLLQRFALSPSKLLDPVRRSQMKGNWEQLSPLEKIQMRAMSGVGGSIEGIGAEEGSSLPGKMSNDPMIYR
jgi:hypothetical protein